MSDFETAADAVVSGDLAALQAMLRADPELVRARSERPHRATLLHYVAANGVEDFRQKTPPNAVEIAKALLDAGAEPDAVADMYQAPATTLDMLVSSCHPAQAGLQGALVDLLIDYGAAPASLMTALAYGYPQAAAALVRRGAPVDSLPAAAGMGYSEQVRAMLPHADAESRHQALALAAQHGHAEIAALLLDAGEDPNRYNPPGNHAHSTPLHQAALAGHLAVVKLLVERGGRLDLEDTVYHGTPLGWARHGGQTQVADYLSAV
jgi:ankyrin repeat protein